MKTRRRRPSTRSSQRLRAAGLECHATDDDVMRVFVPGDGGARDLFALAAAERRAGAAPAPERADARGRVRAARWGERVDRCRFTIRAIGATAGERAPHGPAWAVIARAGIRTLLAQARVPRPAAASSWLPFFVRAVQIYAAANLPQAAFLAPTPETFRDFLEPAGHLRLLHHRLRRRRADRQRSPRQRAADLPVEAADARRVRRSASWRS